jgi:hypothetical protein
LPPGEGGDGIWRGHESIPSIATSVHDILVGFVEPVCELVLALILPDIFDRVKLGRIGRQGDESHVFRNNEVFAAMPASAVEDERGVGARRDGLRDFRKVQVHRFGIGVWHDKSCPRRPRRADSTEEIGPFVAGIAQRAGPASLARPNPRQRAFLAYAGFVLEPDFDRFGLGVLRQMFP